MMQVIDDLIECRLHSILFRQEYNGVEMSFISPWDGRNLVLTINEVYQFQMGEVCRDNIVDQLLLFTPIDADINNEDYVNCLKACLSHTQVSNKVLLESTLAMIKERSLVLLHLTAVIGATATCLARDYILSSPIKT